MTLTGSWEQEIDERDISYLIYMHNHDIDLTGQHLTLLSQFDVPTMLDVSMSEIDGDGKRLSKL